LVSKDIHGHTWEFDAERIAKMLSATDKVPLDADALVNSAHKALGKMTSPYLPTVDGGWEWHTPLANFLNNCVDACHGVRSVSAKGGFRFYDDLRFIVYDKSTQDGVEDASSVEPNLVDGFNLASDERVAWSPQNISAHQVLIPVEVRGSWAPVVT
jgi:hypothetical protein